MDSERYTNQLGTSSWAIAEASFLIIAYVIYIFYRCHMPIEKRGEFLRYYDEKVHREEEDLRIKQAEAKAKSERVWTIVGYIFIGLIVVAFIAFMIFGVFKMR